MQLIRYFVSFRILFCERYMTKCILHEGPAPKSIETNWKTRVWIRADNGEVFSSNDKKLCMFYPWCTELLTTVIPLRAWWLDIFPFYSAVVEGKWNKMARSLQKSQSLDLRYGLNTQGHLPQQHCGEDMAEIVLLASTFIPDGGMDALFFAQPESSHVAACLLFLQQTTRSS